MVILPHGFCLKVLPRHASNLSVVGQFIFTTRIIIHVFVIEEEDKVCSVFSGSVLAVDCLVPVAFFIRAILIAEKFLVEIRLFLCVCTRPCQGASSVIIPFLDHLQHVIAELSVVDDPVLILVDLLK